VSGPGYYLDFPLELAKSIMAGTPESTQSSLVVEQFKLDVTMRTTLVGPHVTYISLVDAGCPSGICQILSSSRAPVAFDYCHTTLSAARDLAPEGAWQADLSWPSV
jgi:hypothetical protein